MSSPATQGQHWLAHNYPRLVRRWKNVAKKSGLIMRPFAEAGGFEIFFLESPRAEDRPMLYLSAGIHGDEAGATEALITWAEGALPFLKQHAVMIFPCLNPWGLTHNSRLDSRGRDLNRSYLGTRVPQIVAQKKLLLGRRFALAIALHEDYDARGVYIYEIPNKGTFLAEAILRAASRHLPIETRSRIEGRTFRNAILRQAIRPDLLPGHPEAFFLHFHCADRTLTVETPSEFAIQDRVAAHVAGLVAATDAFARAHANP